MEKRAEIRVYGVVQGVFFRANAKDRADLLHIRGTIRNEADGSVYIVAEGDEEDLKRLIQWCESSPGYAQVERVLVDWQNQKGNFKKFSIRGL